MSRIIWSEIILTTALIVHDRVQQPASPAIGGELHIIAVAAVTVLSAFGVPTGPNRHRGAATAKGLPQPPVDDHLLAETDGDDGQGGGVQKMDKRTDPVVHGEADHPKDDQYPDEV